MVQGMQEDGEKAEQMRGGDTKGTKGEMGGEFDVASVVKHALSYPPGPCSLIHGATTPREAMTSRILAVSKGASGLSPPTERHIRVP